MKCVIDFKKIKNTDDFYTQLKSVLPLPNYFGNNLDALYDSITGDLPMPLELHFINLNKSKIKAFKGLIETMEELVAEMDDFSFRLSMIEPPHHNSISKA